jgi:hypothetical protein
MVVACRQVIRVDTDGSSMKITQQMQSWFLEQVLNQANSPARHRVAAGDHPEPSSGVKENPDVADGAVQDVAYQAAVDVSAKALQPSLVDFLR